MGSRLGQDESAGLVGRGGVGGEVGGGEITSFPFHSTQLKLGFIAWLGARRRCCAKSGPHLTAKAFAIRSFPSVSSALCQRLFPMMASQPILVRPWGENKPSAFNTTLASLKAPRGRANP